MQPAISPDFIATELADRRAETSLFHVIPVPFEHSVSYGAGTKEGPRAILEASQQLEAFDGESSPLELGIHTTAPVNCAGSIETVLKRIKQQTAIAISSGRIPVLLGGEHTITIGALQALRQSSDEAFGVFQLDAHADLRDSYEGNPYSHACVARRAHENLQLPLYQFGVRALSREEDEYRRTRSIAGVDAKTFHSRGISALELPADFPERLYLTLDVDGLDPSIIRATGTPVPGGPGWFDTLAVLAKVIRNRRVVGFDVVELAPCARDHASSFAAAQLVYAVMGIIQREARF